MREYAGYRAGFSNFAPAFPISRQSGASLCPPIRRIPPLVFLLRRRGGLDLDFLQSIYAATLNLPRSFDRAAQSENRLSRANEWQQPRFG